MKLLKKTINSLEEGKNQIYMISESARQEWNELEEKFEEIHKEVKQVIEDVEKLERLGKKDSRYKLMIVSKNFRKYSEEDIRQAYDTTRGSAN